MELSDSERSWFNSEPQDETNWTNSRATEAVGLIDAEDLKVGERIKAAGKGENLCGELVGRHLGKLLVRN